MQGRRRRRDLETCLEKINGRRRGQFLHRLEDDRRDRAVIRMARGPMAGIEREDEVGRFGTDEARDRADDLPRSARVEVPRWRGRGASVRQRQEDCVCAEELGRRAGFGAPNGREVGEAYRFLLEGMTSP